MKKILLTIAIAVVALMSSCKKEELPYPNTEVHHDYMYAVNGTSGSYNITFQKWGGRADEDSLVSVDSIVGNDWKYEWRYLGHEERFLFIQAVNNNPFGYVTVSIIKDGVVIRTMTTTGNDTARVEIVQ